LEARLTPDSMASSKLFFEVEVISLILATDMSLLLFSVDIFP
jgi:hypothetical protein